MLRDIFGTKESKVITVIVIITLVIISIFAFHAYSQKKKFMEQAVMAENNLKAGNYEQAVEAYLKAISMKNGGEQLLSIGLADAYAGLNDYDSALEVLRSCYQRTSGLKVKEKIEEITSEKTDYEYLQSISRAEVYYSNQEYEKAITEFEKAKQIKSKDATSYKRIAEAYIVLGEYDKARDEVLEGQEITQDERLQHTMALIDTYLNKEQYNALMEQAAECVLQENYRDGIKFYKQAKNLIPGESAAYIELTKVLITREEYDEAIHILKDGIKFTDNIEINDLLNQVTVLKQLKEEKNSLLLSLSNALKTRNFSDVATIMDTELFKENIAENVPAYYNLVNNIPSFFANGNDDILVGVKMIIYNDKSVYYGDIRNGKKVGNGIYFIRTKSGKKPGYYYYDGEWYKDLPNGNGKTVEESTLTDDSGKTFTYRTVTAGTFIDALEDGRMKKSFYSDGAEKGKLYYQADRGIPMPIQQSSYDPYPAPDADSYIIGKITSDDNPSGENYSVKTATVWGFLPLETK